MQISLVCMLVHDTFRSLLDAAITTKPALEVCWVILADNAKVESIFSLILTFDVVGEQGVTNINVLIGF